MHEIIYAQVLPNTNSQSFSLIFLMVPLIIIFYFFLIRPQQKTQKVLQKQIKELKRGDKILTSGGMYLEVNSVKDNIVVVELGKDIKVDIEKAMISKVIPKL